MSMFTPCFFSSYCFAWSAQFLRTCSHRSFQPAISSSRSGLGASKAYNNYLNIVKQEPKHDSQVQHLRYPHQQCCCCFFEMEGTTVFERYRHFCMVAIQSPRSLVQPEFLPRDHHFVPASQLEFLSSICNCNE